MLPEAKGDERECQASAGGEGVDAARSVVTFNEEGDYVPAAVCRLETEDLVDQG